MVLNRCFKNIIFALKRNLIYLIMGKTPFSLKLDDDLAIAVKEQAKKEHRPVNNFIEVVLLKYLEEIRIQESTKNPGE